MSTPQDLEGLLTQLRLARLRQVYRDWIQRAAEQDLGYEEFLRGLLEEEVVAREEKSWQRRLQQAHFPFQRTLEQFDFRSRPELKRQVFLTYLQDSFITEGRSLVLIGPTGLGKTHLAIGVGYQMVQRGYDVRFITAQRLMNRCLLGEDLRARQRELKPYLNCDLLILDELGYLPTVPEIGPLLYEVIATRYEQKATIITSNKSLPEWGRYLHDAALAAALIDRLIHHGEVYYLQGESYRLRGKGGRLRTLGQEEEKRAEEPAPEMEEGPSSPEP